VASVWPLLSFLFVLAVIPLALWLLRRTPMGAGSLHPVARTIGVTALGPHERLVTVEVGQGDDRRWLLLGVTAQQVSHLHTLPPQPLPVPSTASAVPAFGPLLAQWRRHVRRPAMPGDAPSATVGTAR